MTFRFQPERALRRLQVAAVNADLEHKSTVCRITYLVFMTMAVLFLVSSVVLVAIYLASADLVVSFFRSSDNSDSLSSGSSSSSKNISEFFEEGIEGGKEKMNAAVKNLVDQAKKLESPIKSNNFEPSGLEKYKSALDKVVLELSGRLGEFEATLASIEKKK
ncbi:hypothetical protein Aperf_G00000045584 [Anoplocephala perfoliata]